MGDSVESSLNPTLAVSQFSLMGFQKSRLTLAAKQPMFNLKGDFMLTRDELGPLKSFHTKIRPQVLEFLKGAAASDGKYLYRIIEDALLLFVGCQNPIHPDHEELGDQQVCDFIDYGLAGCLAVCGEYEGSWPDETEEERLANTEAEEE